MQRKLTIGAVTVSAPAGLFMLIFFVAPVVLIVVYSFSTAGYYAVSGPLTFSNFTRALDLHIDRQLAWHSLEVAFFTSTITTVLTIAVSYWLRYAPPARRSVVLFLLLITMFASYLVRIYAWRSILGPTGLINVALESLGLIHRPLGFLVFSRFAVVVTQIHWFFPYVLLVTYGGFGPLGPSLLESAQDLGAGPVTRFRQVVLPLIAMPVTTAFMFCFVLSASDYITPQMIGGTNGSLLGDQISISFIQTGDFALGSATAILMLVGFALIYCFLLAALKVAKLDRIQWGNS